MITNTVHFQESVEGCGLGAITVAGGLVNDSEAPAHAMRILEGYALVCLVEGGGSLVEPGQPPVPIAAGDVLLLVPRRPHRYGPGKGERWVEYYVVFEGPVFDLWRRAGLLPNRHTLYRPAPDESWLARIQETTSTAFDLPRPLAAARQCCLVQSLLLELHRSQRTMLLGDLDRQWLLLARQLIDQVPPHLIPDWHAISAASGCSYESFRKRFRSLNGAPPARYRARRIADLACQMIGGGDLTITQVAARLGFANAFHFSRRFKSLTGLSPTEFRRRMPT